MKKNIFKTFILILASVFFFGCQNSVLSPVQEDQKNDVKISGSLGMTGAVPSELISGPSADRTAFPSLSITSYAVWVVDAATNQKVKDGDVDTENMTYEISVELGKSYYLCASAIYSGKTVLSYKSEKITINSDNPLITQNIVLKPVVSANGKGNVFLDITMGSGVSVDKCTILWNGNNQQEIVTAPYVFNMNNSESSSGSYDVTFRFYQGEHLVYEFSDLINVFDNLTTNVWVKNGNEPYLEVDASGRASCKITKACTDSFIQHVFYVDASRQNTNPSGANYTTETGGFYNPCRTFALALEKAAASNSSSDNVRIFIKTTEADQTIHSETISKTINPYINLEVETYVNTPGDKRGKAEFVSDISDSLLKVENNQTYSFTNIIFNGYENCTSDDGLVNIGNDSFGPGNAFFTNCEFINAATVGVGVLKGSAEFEDCKFLDNQNEEGEGGGLFIKSGTSVTLSGTTQINGNVAESGGGIYTDGTLTIKGNCLIGDSVFDTLPTELAYANSAGYGAGIYANSPFTVDSDATLTLAGNFAESMGGGIYFYISGETENLSSTNIKYCTAGEKGGGIYVDEGNGVNITSTVIEHCYSREGGGIYAEGIPVILAQDTVIKDNTAAYGRGIFVDPDVASNYLGMQDNAYVASNNDVYLGSGTTIKLLTDLSLPDDANGVAAIITPQYYNVDTSGNEVEPIQLLAENATGLIAGNYSKFAVKSKDATPAIHWLISSSGKLEKEVLVSMLDTAPTDTNAVYKLSTVADLSKIAGWVNGGSALENIRIKLTSDITIPSDYVSIGNYMDSSNKPFKGIFDGNNKTITFESSSNALFGYAESAEISNIKTKGTFTANTSKSGTVVNYLKGGRLSNCVNNATITTSQGYVGGIIGEAEFLSADRSCVIENCINYGDISSTSNSVGGIIGCTRSVKVINCYNAGNITGTYAVGGIAGWSSGNNSQSPYGTVGSLYENCGNSGEIKATTPSTDRSQKCGAGGIAGGNTSENANWKPDFINCWSSGLIIASSNLNGGIFGTTGYRSFTNCTYTDGMAYGLGVIGSTPSGTDSDNGVSSDNDQIVAMMNNYITGNNKTDYKPWKVEGGKVVFEDM